jgi:hypothetical protein
VAEPRGAGVMEARRRAVAVPAKDAFTLKAQTIDVAPQRDVQGVTWRVRAGVSAKSLADPQRTG